MSKLPFVFKALGDETRINIIRMLVGKELCVCDIMDRFNISQPAISHHLKILKQAEIISDSRNGKWIFYRLNPNFAQPIKSFLEEVSNYEGITRISPYSPHHI